MLLKLGSARICGDKVSTNDVSFVEKIVVFELTSLLENTGKVVAKVRFDITELATLMTSG